MSYPNLIGNVYCANCSKRIETSCITVRENHLIRDYFQFDDGRDNIFCNSDCLAESLMAEEIYLNQEDGE